ncbi:hypothetical protein CBR_g30858 [Chara braunii]|uniref:Reverse transcriptase domain-containing protein n=1 Tax=Chara braunii TaxID=69332 RepID=A0A388LDL0_CHABU|nr:hypothetical protein CBR_g30858 [Chara braunii]|eukprot:GBG80394.1 hypothetical protein CBR_g30858 [Chara braunii]
MPAGKAPGPDEMPVEHIKVCLDVLLPHLLEGFNDVRQGAKPLPEEFGLATIILVHKKGPPKEIRNWWPISLLSAAYKLMAKILANRLACKIPQIVDPTQTGFIPGRWILTNILLARQIVWQAPRHDPPLAFVLLDFEKAYDRVSWPFLLEGLRRQGFGSTFLSMVKCLLGSAASRLLINGYLSDPIAVTRSVCQGCLLSPALYALYIEHLHDMIRADDELEGLKLPGGRQLKSSAFADDTGAVTAITSASVGALQNQVQALQLRTIIWLLLEQDCAPWKTLTLQTMAEAVRLHPADMELALLQSAILTELKRGALWSRFLKAWPDLAPFQLKPSESIDQILQQPLFGNRWIPDNNGEPSPWTGPKGAFGKAWLKAGLARVADLWDLQTKDWQQETTLLKHLEGQKHWKERLCSIKKAILEAWVDTLRTMQRFDRDWVTLSSEGPVRLLFQITAQVGSTWLMVEA